MNDKKLIVYNKDLILKNLLKLLKSKKYEPKIINFIIGNLTELKEYKEDYKQMIDSINSYYRLISINSDPNLDKAKLNLYTLVIKINNSKELENNRFFLPLNSIYSYFDFNSNDK
jgi:hypothetical protein